MDTTASANLKDDMARNDSTNEWEFLSDTMGYNMWPAFDGLMDDLEYYHKKKKESKPEVDITIFQRYVDEETRPLINARRTDEVCEFLAVSNALGGEVGELQNIVKKIVRGGYFYDTHNLHDELILEAGDVLHYFLRLLRAANIDLDTVMEANIAKLEERKLNAAQATAITKASIESGVRESSSVRDHQRGSVC